MTGRLCRLALCWWLLVPPIASAGADDAGWRQLMERAGVVTLISAAPPVVTGDGTRLARLRRDFTSRGDERAYALDLVEFDCGGDRYRYREILIYDRDDLLMHRYILTDQFGPVPADTAVSLAREAICRPVPARRNP